MLTTESAAKKKWCPLARVEGNNRINNALTDGFEHTADPYHCIAGKCMFWREMAQGHHKAAVSAHSMEKHGYCGFAGRPEIDLGW